MNERCCVCGKTFEEGQTVALISKGAIKNGEFSPKKNWGTAHFEPCFERAIDSPQMTLDRVKKLSKMKPKAASGAK